MTGAAAGQEGRAARLPWSGRRMGFFFTFSGLGWRFVLDVRIRLGLLLALGFLGGWRFVLHVRIRFGLLLALELARRHADAEYYGVKELVKAGDRENLSSVNVNTRNPWGEPLRLTAAHSQLWYISH